MGILFFTVLLKLKTSVFILELCAIFINKIKGYLILKLFAYCAVVRFCMYNFSIFIPSCFKRAIFVSIPPA